MVNYGLYGKEKKPIMAREKTHNYGMAIYGKCKLIFLKKPLIYCFDPCKRETSGLKWILKKKLRHFRPLVSCSFMIPKKVSNN
jgi:hypothetical protein